MLDNGDEYNVDANWLNNEKLNNWKSWSCEAGYSRILIDSDLSVYGGQCRNDYLGNLETTWDILYAPTTCNRDSCSGCTDDLLVRKNLIN